MDIILKDIEKAISAKCYYVAVHMALALPDICAALEAPNGETSGKKYRAWYNANLSAIYPLLTATDCYSLRCGVIHQGRFGHPNMQYSRVIFAIPDPNVPTLHNNILDDALNLDAVTFCSDVIASTRAWYASKQSDLNVQNNLPNLVQYRPNGFLPYMAGVPTIG